MLRLAPVKNTDFKIGGRNPEGTKLTKDEIEFIKNEIKIIKADESIFVFNDQRFLNKNTQYDLMEGKIFVTRSVFPDFRYGSACPKDLMRVRTILACEYYGRKTYWFKRLLGDSEYVGPTLDNKINEEMYASIITAKITPNLDERDKRDLIQNAMYEASKVNCVVELDSFMKEILFS